MKSHLIGYKEIKPERLSHPIPKLDRVSPRVDLAHYTFLNAEMHKQAHEWWLHCIH
jgi:hypothetical protein